MTNENGRANARDEVVRGNESLEAARLLIEHALLRDGISRAYYAVYHVVRALLLVKGLDPRTHRGAAQLFNLHYVKDGPLDEKTAGLLAHLETYRELSDYTSSASFTEAQARSELERAIRFLEACRPLLPE